MVEIIKKNLTTIKKSSNVNIVQPKELDPILRKDGTKMEESTRRRFWRSILRDS